MLFRTRHRSSQPVFVSEIALLTELSKMQELNSATPIIEFLDVDRRETSAQLPLVVARKA